MENGNHQKLKFITSNSKVSPIDGNSSNWDSRHVKDTRQAMYVQSSTEARSCNHCCSGKTISIT